MKAVDKSKFVVYRDRAEGFLHSMRDLLILDDVGHSHAIALLAVHSAISLADALLIHETGLRSDDDHPAASKALKRLAKARGVKSDRIGNFSRLLSKKNFFAYDDKYSNRDKDVKAASIHAKTFAAWVYESFPAIARNQEV